MKVLWVINIMLPAYARAQGLRYSTREGWLSGSFERMRADREQDGAGTTGAPSARDITLGICFPSPQGSVRTELYGVTFYGFLEDTAHPETYDAALETRFREVLSEFDPDIVHIFGTEFPHALAMVRAFDRPARTLLGLQGMCGEIAEVYMADLPSRVRKIPTLRDVLRKDSLKQQQEKFRKRAANEREAILGARHVTGRTDFDREEVLRIHPEASYHHMNETLRPCFYEGAWSQGQAVAHSLFLSQGDYPLKGFHYVLQALPALLRAYPDTHLYVAGQSLIGPPDRSTVTVPSEEHAAVEEGSRYPRWLTISAYGKYLRRLIRENDLREHVTMLGKLTAEQMKEQYLRASVFVCASALENSSNALGEAMLLGMPVAAAATGGIPSMVTHEKEGLLFPPGNPGALTEAVVRLFETPHLARQLSERARERARNVHDPDLNYARLIQIYRTMVLTV